MFSSQEPTITAEYCPHPFEKNKTLVKSTVENVIAAEAKSPETVVILLDKSSSMRDDMENMRNQTKLWIKKLQERKPQPRIILAAFDKKGEILGDSSDKNLSLSESSAENLKVGFRTNMEAGLNIVADQLSKAEFNASNTTVFVLTDGVDDGIKTKDKADEVINRFKGKVGQVRLVPLGYGVFYSKEILEAIGSHCDCAHTFLKNAEALEHFALSRNQEYLGRRAKVEQSFNNETRKNESGITQKEPWTQLYEVHSNPEKLKNNSIVTTIDDKKYSVELKLASRSTQNELIEVCVNKKVKEIIPKVEEFLARMNNSHMVLHMQRDKELAGKQHAVQRNYIEQLSALLSLLVRANYQSPDVLILQTILQQCAQLKSLSKEQSNDMTSTNSALYSSGGGSAVRSNMMRNNQVKLFGTTEFIYKYRSRKIITRDLNFCKVQEPVVSLDAGVINRPAIFADIEAIRRSVKLFLNINLPIDVELKKIVDESRKLLVEEYNSKSQYYVNLPVEHLLEPNGSQNTCRHHALLSAILLGRHPKLTSVNMFRSTAHTLDAHSWVMCETNAGERYLVDSHHGKVFNMSNRSDRADAITYYQNNQLHGVLADLFNHGHKIWGWEIDEHPPILQLTPEAINARIYPKDTHGEVVTIANIAPDKYRCPLTGEMMRCPVIVYDQGEDIPYTFDYYNLQQWIQLEGHKERYATNPLTQKTIDINRMFHDLNLVREMWVYVQTCAAPKEEASKGAVPISFDSKPVFRSLSTTLRSQLVKQASENSRVLSDLQKLPTDCLTVNKLKFEAEVECKEKPIESKSDLAIISSSQPQTEIFSERDELKTDIRLPASSEVKSTSNPEETKPPEFIVSAKQVPLPQNNTTFQPKGLFNRLQKKVSNYLEGDVYHEFKAELAKLEEDKISNDIINQMKHFIRNIAELEREENFFKYNSMQHEQLKNNLKSVMEQMSSFLKNPSSSENLIKSLSTLQATAKSLLEKTRNDEIKNISFLKKLQFHAKSLVSMIFKWMTSIGVVAGIAGGIAGASVGAAGGTVAAAVVSSPAAGVLAPLGSAVGASAGFGVGATIGCITGGIAGAAYGFFAGANRIIVGQDQLTHNSADSLIKKIEDWRSLKGG